MKRRAVFLVSLLLLFSSVSNALAAKMVQSFSTDYFSIYIPGDWIIDTSGAADYWGMLDFGFMYAKDESMMIEAKLNYYSEWAEDSLWSASQELWAEYLAFVFDDFKEESPRMIAEIHAGQYPGVVITGTNAYGSYLFGEIMINAYAYDFYFYRLNPDGSINSDITQEEIDFFVSVMETFVPGQLSSVRQ